MDGIPATGSGSTVSGLSTSEVHLLPNLAHADAAELTTWLGSSQLAPRSTFVVHGEPSSADALRRTLRDELGWAASVPAHGGTSSCDGHPMTSEWERLEQVALALDPPARFDADTLTSRPATVRRYLTAAITAGTPPAHGARISMRGTTSLAGGSRTAQPAPRPAPRYRLGCESGRRGPAPCEHHRRTARRARTRRTTQAQPAASWDRHDRKGQLR